MENKLTDKNILPDPLVPNDIDLRDFVFMPLDVLRLRDSELAATPDAEAFRCSVLAWCASWHQIPASSLPDDDVVLARLLGFGRDLKGWKKVRAADGMRGWIKCSDGRLYHPVVAEKAIDAWEAKKAQRARTEAARKARDEKRQKELQGQQHSLSQTNKSSVTDAATESKGQGQGQGQGELTTSEAKASGGRPPLLTDPEEIIFSFGVTLLTNAGTAEKQARSFLGGLRKQHGDQVLIDKLRECAKAKPLEPVAWLAAALPPKSTGAGRTPTPDNFANRDYGTGGLL